MIFYVREFCVFSNSPPFVLGGISSFFFPLLSSVPFLTLNHDPLCVLLGERVGLSRPPGNGSTPPPPPPRNSAEPFTPLTQGRGWRVCGTLTCPEAAL